MADLVEYKQRNPDTRFEKTDWPLRAVGVVAIVTLLLLATTPFVLMVAFPKALPDVSRKLWITPPEPRLQTDPEADLVRFRAKEEKELNSYYWIDRRKGIVHVPIDVEMKALARSGIPGFPKAAP